jgi:hypothetical protein
MAIDINDKLRNECQAALDNLKKLDIAKTSELQAKLEWCIGSYDFDKNPAGLAEFGGQALKELKKIKEKDTKKVTKKMIDGLEGAIAKFEAK